MASGDVADYAEVAKALNRRIATLTGDTDITAASYASEAVVENVSASVVSGRTYRIRYITHAQAVTTTNTLLTRIRAGASAGLSGVQITYRNLVLPTGIDSSIIEADYTASVTGTIFFQVTAARTAGSTNSQFRGSAGQPRSLIVEYAYG